MALRALVTLILLTGLGTAWADGTAAQELEVPVELQLRTFTRVVEFDRAFHARVGETFSVGIVYQPQVRASYTAARDFLEVSSNEEFSEVRGVPSEFHMVELETLDQLGHAIRDLELDAIYLSPLRRIDVSQVSSVSADSGVVTFTGVREYLDAGIGLGLGSRSGRLEILVNLAACPVPGARPEFSAPPDGHGHL